jgi:hypothetical protein
MPSSRVDLVTSGPSLTSSPTSVCATRALTPVSTTSVPSIRRAEAVRVSVPATLASTSFMPVMSRIMIRARRAWAPESAASSSEWARSASIVPMRGMTKMPSVMGMTGVESSASFSACILTTSSWRAARCASAR